MLQSKMLMAERWNKYIDFILSKEMSQIYSIYKTYVQKLHVMKYVMETKDLLLHFQARVFLQKDLSAISKTTRITKIFPLIKNSF